MRRRLCPDASEEAGGILERGLMTILGAVERDCDLDVSELAVYGQVRGRYTRAGSPFTVQKDQLWMERSGSEAGADDVVAAPYTTKTVIFERRAQLRLVAEDDHVPGTDGMEGRQYRLLEETQIQRVRREDGAREAARDALKWATQPRSPPAGCAHRARSASLAAGGVEEPDRPQQGVQYSEACSRPERFVAAHEAEHPVVFGDAERVAAVGGAQLRGRDPAA